MAVGDPIATVKRKVNFADRFDPNSKTLSADFMGDDISPVFDALNAKPGDYIETSEEIESYLRSSRREYTQAIICNTHTDFKQNLDRDGLRDWYKQSYEQLDINYHFLILRDGRIQINKGINEEPPFTPVDIHVPFSISIAMVGGMKDGLYDIDTCSPNQWKTLRAFLKVFYTILPGGQVFGHSDINLNAPDPGFDAVRYVETSFGKRNTLRNADARAKGSLSIYDLIGESRRRGFR